ncbi:MAG: DUF6036 family nucleotidyltransferase [Fimbriimonadaceae bacterium]
MNSDFKELLSLFNQYDVKYMVVGGYAVMLYSEPRYTKDIDIAISRDQENVDRVRSALEEFGFPMSDQAALDLAQPNRMVKFGREPSRIDILNQVDGIDFDAEWNERNTRDVNGIAIAFISKRGLIDSKRACGRPQDLLDLTRLEEAEQ